VNTVINIVLFDYGGVIAEEGFRAGLRAIARHNGLDPEAFYHTVCRIIADSGYLTGDSDETAFWACLRREYGLARPDAELRSEILNRFTLQPGMLDIAARLRRAGLRVGILSDHTNWLDELDRRDCFFDCFDPVFNSFHIHASKYRGDLFDAVAAQLGTPPESILLIDDSAANIDKARQRGFAAILYEDEQSFMRKLTKIFPSVFQCAQ
jgi:putative hydrolase of the HAD superfamily